MPRFTIKVEGGFTGSMDADIADLRRNFGKEALEEKLRRALAESFLSNIKDRYSANEMEMGLVRRISNKKLTGKLSQRDQDRLHRIDSNMRNKLRQVAQEMGPGDLKEVREAYKQRQHLLAAYRSAKYVAKKQSSERGKLVHQALRQAAQERFKRMKQVRDLLVDRSLIKVTYGMRNGVVNSITLSIGNIDKLDKIKTPSATPKITGRKTNSKYDILWRQMEFGTGVFAFPNTRAGGRYRTSAGTWWFGPRKGFGVHFAGNKPGQLLRQKTGEFYTQDALQFERRLRQLFK